MTKDKVTPHPGIVLQMENIQNGIVTLSVLLVSLAFLKTKRWKAVYLMN